MKLEDIKYIDVTVTMMGPDGQLTTVSKKFKPPVSLVFDQQLEEFPGDDLWLNRRPTGYQSIKIGGYVDPPSSRTGS